MSFSYFLVSFGCLAFATAQLYPEDVSDGPCTNPPIAANFTKFLPIILSPQAYTVALGSQSMFRAYAQTFLGRPAQSQSELDHLCLSILFTDSVATQTGFANKTNIQQCVPYDVANGLGRFNFWTTLAQSPGVDTSNENNTVDTFVWSDGVKHGLLVRCLNGIRQDWKVVSIGNPDPWVKPLVNSIITGLGMNASNTFDYTTDSSYTCPATPGTAVYVLNVLSNLQIATIKLPGGILGILNVLDTALQTAIKTLLSLGNVITSFLPNINLG